MEDYRLSGQCADGGSSFVMYSGRGRAVSIDFCSSVGVEILEEGNGSGVRLNECCLGGGIDGQYLYKRHGVMKGFF